MGRMVGRVAVPSLAVPSLAVALVLAGCGGGSSGAAAAAPSVRASASAVREPRSTDPAPGSSAPGPAGTASVGREPAAPGGAGLPLVASAEWLGSARIGQPAAAFARALGRQLPPVAAEPGSECWVRPLTGLAGVTLMVTGSRPDGLVRRVDVTDARVRTTAGVGVGSTEAQVRAAYHGAVQVEPHKYTPGAHYLKVSGGRHDLVFESDAAHRVTRYRFGEPEQVSWVELCG